MCNQHLQHTSEVNFFRERKRNGQPQLPVVHRKKLITIHNTCLALELVYDARVCNTFRMWMSNMWHWYDHMIHWNQPFWSIYTTCDIGTIIWSTEINLFDQSTQDGMEHSSAKLVLCKTPTKSRTQNSAPRLFQQYMMQSRGSLQHWKACCLPIPFNTVLSLICIWRWCWHNNGTFRWWGTHFSSFPPGHKLFKLNWSWFVRIQDYQCSFSLVVRQIYTELSTKCTQLFYLKGTVFVHVELIKFGANNFFIL